MCSRAVVDTIYMSFDQDCNHALELDEVLDAVQNNSEKLADVWEIFGRTLVSRV